MSSKSYPLSNHSPCSLSSGARGQASGMLSSVSCSNRWSLRFAPATTTPSGTPRPSTRRLRFVPRLLRSVGFGPVLFPPERCLRHRPVHRLIRPLNLPQFVVFLQAQRPELLEYPCLGPFLEAAMGSTAGAEVRRIQGIPLATGAQHEEDGVHGLAIIDTRAMTAQRMRRSGRQQRLKLRPEDVRHAPVPWLLHSARSLGRVHAHPRCRPSHLSVWPIWLPNGIGSKERVPLQPQAVV